MDEDSDAQKWSYNKSTGDITIKLAYQMLSEDIPYFKQWWHSFRSWQAPYRIIIFYLLVFANRLLTRDNLMKRGMVSPNLYVLCGDAEESHYNLFVTCNSTISIWLFIECILKCSHGWSGNTVSDCFH